MPFFTQGPADFSAGRPQDLSDIRSSFGQSFGASVAEGAAEMPTTRIAGAALRYGMGDMGETLAPDDANKRFGLPGLSFDKPITDTLANDLYQSRKTQLLRDQAISSGPQNIFAKSANFAGGMIPQFLDPINAASVFLPGVGAEAIGAGLVRSAELLEGAGAETLAGGASSLSSGFSNARAALASSRTGRIAGGAIEGAAGQAALEPIDYELDQSEHRDWSMTQALTDLAFGAVMGGAAGAFGHGRVGEHAEPGSSEAAPQLPGEERLASLTPDQRGSVLNEAVSAMVEDRPSVAPELMDHFDPEGSRELRSEREAPLSEPVRMGQFPEGINETSGYPVMLEEGYHNEKTGGGIGRLHIDTQRGGRIRNKGYPNVATYVQDVVQNHNAIYRDPENGSIFMARLSGDQRRRANHDAAVVHLVPSGDGHYTVATAGPFARSYLEKKEALWQSDRGTDTPPFGQGAAFRTDPQDMSGSGRFRSDGVQSDDANIGNGAIDRNIPDAIRDRNAQSLSDAAERAVSGDAPEVVAARRAVDNIIRHAPKYDATTADEELAAAERMASDAEDQLRALMGDELDEAGNAIAAPFEEAAAILDGDAKAYESAASCLWNASR